MSENIVDDQIIELNCPGCKKLISMPVKRFRLEGNNCPHECGTVFPSKALKQQLKTLEKDLKLRLTKNLVDNNVVSYL